MGYGALGLTTSAIATLYNAGSPLGVYFDYSSVAMKARYPAGGVITATVTATAPTVGETTITVLYAVPV